MLHEQELSAPIAAGAETTFTVNPTSLPERGAITIFAVVDPDRSIDECDEANNRDQAETELLCEIGPD